MKLYKVKAETQTGKVAAKECDTESEAIEYARCFARRGFSFIRIIKQ